MKLVPLSDCRNICKWSSRQGAVLPLLAIVLPVMMIMASFAVNFSYMQLTRTELKIASDSAARAAGRQLLATGDTSASYLAAVEAGKRNTVAGRELKFSPSDVEFGTSLRSALTNRYAFTPGGVNVNAVRLNAQLTSGSATGAIGMIFPTFGAVSQFESGETSTSSQVELDIALVLDRSGSMAYGDTEDSAARAALGLGPAIAPPGWWFCDPAPDASRWRDLVEAVEVFLVVLNKSPQYENISLVTYGSASARDVDLTGDYPSILAGMQVYSDNLCSGKTNITAGINEGINTLSDPFFGRPWAAKVIVVLTDGQHNVGSGPESAAADAFNNGIAVYTVTFSAEADQSRMQTVAENGGGTHFHAADKEALKQTFNDMATNLPTLLTQ